MARTTPSPGPLPKASACLPASPATSWKLQLPGSSELVLDNIHPKPQEEDHDNHALCSGAPSPLQQHPPSQRVPSTPRKTTQWVSTALMLTVPRCQEDRDHRSGRKGPAAWQCRLGMMPTSAQCTHYSVCSFPSTHPGGLTAARVSQTCHPWGFAQNLGT